MATEKRKATRKSRKQAQAYLIVAGNGKLVLVAGDTGKVSSVEGKNAAKVLRLLKDRQKITQEVAELLEGATLGEADVYIIDPPPKPKPK
jgi:hypothetical protein